MAEGEFPKTDGDIYFASEFNRVNDMGFLGSGAINSTINSGTAFQLIGSRLIDEGTIVTDQILLKIYWDGIAGGAGRPDEFRAVISGTGNTAVHLGSNMTNAAAYVGNTRIPLVNSSVQMGAIGEFYNIGGDTEGVVITEVQADINAGSDFCVFFEAKTDTNTVRIDKYFMNYERWS